MIGGKHDTVSFNVSIGKYGDRATSSTPAMRPLSNGHKSYFVPWKDNKPCCMVECYWEDVEHRYLIGQNFDGQNRRILGVSVETFARRKILSVENFVRRN